MANLCGCIAPREPLDDAQFRPMGLRDSAGTAGGGGETLIDFKGAVLGLTRPLPKTVFAHSAFDLHREVGGVKHALDTLHRADLKAIRKRVKKRAPRPRSLAEPDAYEPIPSVASVAQKEKRLQELLLETAGPDMGKNRKPASRIKPALVPDPEEMMNKSDIADFRLEYLQKDIARRYESLRDGSFRTLKAQKGRQEIPIGIMTDSDHNEVILYDQYPQGTRMSESQSNYFARSHKSLVDIGLEAPHVHPKIKEYDWREAYLKQEMAMGRRKG